MAFNVLSIFSLFLPATVFAGGAFIFYKGYSLGMDSGKEGRLSGKAETSAPLLSTLSGKKCVYCRMSVECNSGGKENWEKIIVLESATPFSVAGTAINQSKAAFHISRKESVSGRMSKKFREPFRALVDLAKNATLINLLINTIKSVYRFVRRTFLYMTGSTDPESDDKFIDDRIIDAIISRPGGKELLKHYGKVIRITEEFIPEGEAIYIAGADPKGEVVVSDKDDGSADSFRREQGFVRMGVGAGLIILSLMISVLILLS
jgi:hypothetical protein